MLLPIWVSKKYVFSKYYLKLLSFFFRDLSNYDWGVGQLDAVMDRNEIKGSHFLVLTSFGDHCLHHFFPTLDHGMLNLLYPTFDQLLKRFDVNLRMVSQWEIFKGGFQQLKRVTPNNSPPDLKKKFNWRRIWNWVFQSESLHRVVIWFQSSLPRCESYKIIM